MALAKLWAIELLTSLDPRYRTRYYSIYSYHSLNVLIQMTNLFANVLMNSYEQLIISHHSLMNVSSSDIFPDSDSPIFSDWLSTIL